MCQSVFTPALATEYVVVSSDGSCSNSVDESLEVPKPAPALTRTWNDEMTMYVMLKYRKWQISERNNISLGQFHRECAAALMEDFHIYKTPTQIRDKVNNTKSAFSV